MDLLGHFVVSLDFELLWGVRDKRSVADYRDNLLGVRRAVPALLSLFDRYSVHATWATVGLLFCSGREDALRSSPTKKPRYDNLRYSPYQDHSTWGDDETSDPFRFAPSLVDAIAEAPGQELATHTYSHYYCLEAGADVGSFGDDLKAAMAVAARRSIQLKSIVFPRNQVHADYLPVCAAAGLTSYRGTLPGRLYNPVNEQAQSRLIRGQRLLDNYLPLTAERSTRLSDLGEVLPYNIPASSFLRPYNRQVALLDGRRLHRITAELTHAASNGRIYHLWWHPHNFGRDLRENLDFLSRVLAHYSELRRRYGMRSSTMAEIADEHRQSRGAVA
jgi:hypothetical protein